MASSGCARRQRAGACLRHARGLRRAKEIGYRPPRAVARRRGVALDAAEALGDTVGRRVRGWRHSIFTQQRSASSLTAAARSRARGAIAADRRCAGRRRGGRPKTWSALREGRGGAVVVAHALAGGRREARRRRVAGPSPPAPLVADCRRLGHERLARPGASSSGPGAAPSAVRGRTPPSRRSEPFRWISRGQTGSERPALSCQTLGGAAPRGRTCFSRQRRSPRRGRAGAIGGRGDGPGDVPRRGSGRRRGGRVRCSRSGMGER